MALFADLLTKTPLKYPVGLVKGFLNSAFPIVNRLYGVNKDSKQLTADTKQMVANNNAKLLAIRNAKTPEQARKIALEATKSIDDISNRSDAMINRTTTDLKTSQGKKNFSQILLDSTISTLSGYGMARGAFTPKMFNPLTAGGLFTDSMVGLSTYNAAKEGKPIAEAIGQGVGAIPAFMGFNKLTNPFAAKILAPVTKLIPATEKMIQYGVPERVAVAGTNVIQGIGSDLATGRKTDWRSMALDAGVGLIGGKQMFDSPTGVSSLKKPVMDGAEADEIFKLKKQYDVIGDNVDLTNPSRPASDNWGNLPQKSMDEFNQVSSTITNVFKHYFPDYKKPPTVSKQMELLTGMANENKAFGIPNLAMGVVDGKKIPSKIEVDMNRYKTGEMGYTLKGVKVDQEYLDLLKKKGFGENQIDYAIKITNEAGDVKNAKGFVFGVLRKMNPGVEKKIGYSASLKTSVDDALKIDEAVAREQAKISIPGELTNDEILLKNGYPKNEIDLMSEDSKMLVVNDIKAYDPNLAKPELNSIKTNQTATIPTSPEVAKPTINDQLVGEQGKISYRDYGDEAYLATTSRNTEEFKNKFIDQNLENVLKMTGDRDKLMPETEKLLLAKNVIENEFVKRTGMSFEEFFGNVQADRTGTIPNVKPVVESTVPPITPPIETAPISFTQKIMDRLNNLKQNLIEPKKINQLNDSERGVAIQNHVAAFDEMGQNIKAELATRGISEPDFAAMVRGEIETTPQAKDLVDSWQNIFKHEDATFRANKDFGKQENYWPMESDDSQISKGLTEFLPDTFVSKINQMLGHYLPSTGKMAKEGSFNTDPAQILHNYGEQEALSRYDKKGLFQGKIEELVKGIRDGTQNLYDKKGKTITDYLEMLNPSKDRIKNNTEIHSFIGEDWATNENRNFSKLGDDIYSVYVKVRDNKANATTLKEEFAPLLENGDPQEMISWMAKQLNITDPKALSLFNSKANWMIENIGAEKLYNNIANKLMYDQPVQNLLDTLTKYEFDGTTKKFLNEWIEKQFAERFVNKSLAANIADGTNRIFRIAQLGLNFKTAALQPLEIVRSFAKMPAETLNAFKKSLTDRNYLKEIENKYKVSGSNPYFIDEDTIKVGEVSIPKKALSKLEQTGFFALQKAEDFKNKIFAGTAEQSGQQLGLEGQKLTDYVRNYVYKYGLKMDSTTIPLMFAGKSDGAAFRRLLFQYGQYAISKLVHRVDAIKEKDYKYLAGMIGGDLATFAVLNQLFGVNVSNFLKGEGMISFGPIVSVGEDLFAAGQGYTTDLASDNPEEANNNLLKELGRLGLANVVPFGAQINKTTKMANILDKGYYESAGGRVGYIPPENPVKQGWGLVAGIQSTDEKQVYDKSGYKVLPETVSNQIKEVMKTDKETGRQMYTQARAAESAKKEEKRLINKTMSEILKGGSTITPEQKTVVSDRQKLVSEVVAQGITDTNQIKATIDSQIKSAGLTTPSPTLSEIEVYKNLAKTSEPASLYDTVAQNKAEKDRQTQLNRIMTSEDYVDITQDQRGQVASKLGFTDADMKTWQTSQLTKMTTKDTADYIIANKEVDFVSLYKADALTLSVAQELERRGYISDADLLMENMKLTDPYYQNKALRKAKLDFGTKKLKLAADTATKMNNENLKTMKQILAKKSTSTFKPKVTKFTSTKSVRSSLAKPTRYTVKKLTPNF